MHTGPAFLHSLSVYAPISFDSLHSMHFLCASFSHSLHLGLPILHPLSLYASLTFNTPHSMQVFCASFSHSLHLDLIFLHSLPEYASLTFNMPHSTQVFSPATGCETGCEMSAGATRPNAILSDSVPAAVASAGVAVIVGHGLRP